MRRKEVYPEGEIKKAPGKIMVHYRYFFLVFLVPESVSSL